MNYYGYSLLELIIALTIIAILTISNNWFMGSSTLQQQVADHRSSLEQLITTARQQAIARVQTITLCPLDINRRCHNQWQDRLSVFIDNNSNAQMDSDELLITDLALTPITDSDSLIPQIKWRTNNSYIRFFSSGRVNAFGTLKYCLMSGDNTFAFDIIIARAGRIRSQWVTTSHNCNN